MQSQIAIPQKYGAMGLDELSRRIAARKDELGDSLCILAHHYQRDEVIALAEFTGDSLKLSQLAASQKRAKYIVFCGVHFMAESADILSGPDQIVCLPNMLAGCAMADMAEDAATAAPLEEISALTGEKVVPVTYVNSAAAVKAVTARAGGACCTSGNVRNVFAWALDETGGGGQKIFAIPDEHLGRNTAVAMGYSLDDCVVYDPLLPCGGLSARDVERARFILWKGYCYVHQLFSTDDVTNVRSRYPDIRVIVHPECPHELVQLADASGSTEQIIRAVGEGEPASRWAIGTESNLVNRLAKRHADRFIRTLSEAPALCAQMHRIDLPHLLWVLDNLAEGNVVNRVSVPDDIARDARVALQRMVDLKAVGEATPTRRRR